MNNKKLNDEDNEVIEHYYYELNNKEIGGIIFGIGIFLFIIACIIYYLMTKNYIKINFKQGMNGKGKDLKAVLFILLILCIFGCIIVAIIYFFVPDKKNNQL